MRQRGTTCPHRTFEPCEPLQSIASAIVTVRSCSFGRMSRLEIHALE